MVKQTMFTVYLGEAADDSNQVLEDTLDAAEDESTKL
jgi:hypothetical protein